MAAIIIVTFFILAGLVGAAVYFIHGDRLLNLLKSVSGESSEKYEDNPQPPATVMSEAAFIPEGIEFESEDDTGEINNHRHQVRPLTHFFILPFFNQGSLHSGRKCMQ